MSENRASDIPTIPGGDVKIYLRKDPDQQKQRIADKGAR